MLNFFRAKLNGFIIWVIVGLIVLVFVLSAGSYLFKKIDFDTLVEVEGNKINLSLVNQQYSAFIKQHYAKKKYNNIDLDPIKLKKQILDSLVNRLALIKGLDNNKFNIHPEKILEIIKSNKEFLVDGHFSKQKYTEFLQKLGTKDLENYKYFLKNQLIHEQLNNIFLLSNYVLPTELDDFLFKWFQQRKVGYVIIPKSHLKIVEPTSLELENYYKLHQEHFIAPETLKIQYLEVTGTDLMAKIDPKKEDLLEYFNKHPEYYTSPELFNLRHILINFSSHFEAAATAANSVGSSANEVKDLALEKANMVFNQLKSGRSFKSLAKQYSEDQSTASKGGDLGWIGKGEIEDPAFEQAAFSLSKNGEYSGVIKTQFGYQIVQLVEKRPSKVHKFNEVKDKVIENYKEEMIQPKLMELYNKLADGSEKNLDLVELSKELELEIKQSNHFSSRGEPTGIASYSEVVTAAFSGKKIDQNSEVIRINDDHYIIFRLIERNAQHQQNFEECIEDVKSALRKELVKQQTEKYTKDFALELAKVKFPGKMCKNRNLDWKLEMLDRNNQSISSEIIKAAFSLPKVKVQKTFALNNGDYLILQLLEIKDPDLEKIIAEYKSLKEKMQEELILIKAYLEQNLYERELYKDVKIKFIRSIDDLLGS